MNLTKKINFYSPIFNFSFIVYIFFLLISCNRDDDSITETAPVIYPEQALYILNEGSWGHDNSSLSYFNFQSQNMTNHYFSLQNPTEGGLGDVGNDLQIYKDRMYAVMNSSNYVEVMDAKSCKHLGKITIPSCRSITFKGPYAYVTSFASQQPNGNGYVAKINLDNLQVIAETTVGRQPEGLAIFRNKIYVANSGGYSGGNYEKTVSVIDLSSFTEVKKIEVGTNLSKIKIDKNGKIWITSLGDYASIPPSLYILDSENEKILNKIEISISDMDFFENKLYYYGTNYIDGKAIHDYGTIEVDTYKKSSLISATPEAYLMQPYGIKANPDNGDFYIADALDFQSPGKIYLFSSKGNLKGVKNVGVIPAHFAIYKK